jgi:NADH-quinone oxidoreductase subunit C
MTQPAVAKSQLPAPGLADEIRKALPNVPCEASETGTDVDLRVDVAHLKALIQGLRDRLGFDYLRNLVGIDFEAEGMELKYQLYSFKDNRGVQVTVPTSAGHPHLPSVVDLYPAADWHEREAAEMLGFVFDGHPNLKNLLLEEDLHIHPLLKAHPLQAAEILQGIESGPPGFPS